MATLFAPPGILSAYSVAEDGTDPDIRYGTHLRIFAGMGASFPLTPFAIFRINSEPSEPHIHVTDRDGNRTDRFELRDLGGYGEATLLLREDNERRTVSVELEDPDGQVSHVTLVDQNDRIIMERDKPPWIFSAPLMHKLIVEGESSYVYIRSRSVHIGSIIDGRADVSAVVGFPVSGMYNWYTGFQDRNEGLSRVWYGAPLRLNTMDRPVGPFDAINEDAEQMRVEAMLNSSKVGGGYEKMLQTLIEDEPAPWLQTERTEIITDAGKKQYVYAPRLGTLQMAALDPGLARFLGFACHIDDFPVPGEQFSWDTLAVAGLFAIDPRDFNRRNLDLSGLLREPAPNAERLTDMLINALNEASGRHMESEIRDLSVLVREKGFIVAPMVTLVSPLAPWLPPTLPYPQILQHSWQASENFTPSNHYRADFSFPRAPLATIIALAGRTNGDWSSRHDMIDVPGFHLQQRATPKILGHTKLKIPGHTVNGSTAATFESAGIISDQDIPAEAFQVEYRVTASDFFGRFGKSVGFDIGPPPRPVPPPPVLRFHVERSKHTSAELTSDGLLSPGALKITVAVPSNTDGRFTDNEETRLGSAILVPRIDDLAAGSLTLSWLELTLDNLDPVRVDVAAPGIFNVDFQLPVLGPQENKRWLLKGKFINSAGIHSETASLPVEATDVRPPKTYPSGIGLFWTSAPGPSPEVELKLTWPAKPGSQHRVYLIDQQGLGLTADEISEARPEWIPSRGRIAAAGCDKVLNGTPPDPKAFRLVTDKPVEARADGKAYLTTTLPRSLSTVQFYRIVPLGPDGAEPPFNTCGIVPVAVPDSRRPPAPRLDGEIDPATGTARLRILAESFDRNSLERDEPGLYNVDNEGNEKPHFTIRRAVGAVADPLYAIPVGKGRLTLQNTAAPVSLFSASYTDTNKGNSLEPFVRYIYWAEVSLPSERRVPAGFIERNPEGGVTVADPAGSKDHPRPASLPSPPRVLMNIPDDPPLAPLPESIQTIRKPVNAAGEVEVTLEITDVPRAHKKAVGPYRLAVWAQWPGQNIEKVTFAGAATPPGTWPDISSGNVTFALVPPDPDNPPDNLTIRVAFVDPVGRMSDITILSLAPGQPDLPGPELSPVSVSIIAGPILRPPPRIIASWQILTVNPEQPGNWRLKATIRRPNRPMDQPLDLEYSLDSVPLVRDPARLSPGQVNLLYNKICRIQGTQQYFIFLRIIRPIEITITLTDPHGRSATQTGGLA
jgi:hypothetical protein